MREKVFGDGPRVAIDGNAKARILAHARALKRRTERGKHYGKLTAKYVDVLHALAWLIHDSKTGQCNPSYATIADKAGCAESTVQLAIKALEAARLLGWVNRIRRVRERVRDELLGGWTWVWRIVRTSNAYVLYDPGIPVPRRNTGKPESRRRLIDKVKKNGPPPPDSSFRSVEEVLAQALRHIQREDRAMRQPARHRQDTERASRARLRPLSRGR